MLCMRLCRRWVHKGGTHSAAASDCMPACVTAAAASRLRPHPQPRQRQVAGQAARQPCVAQRQLLQLGRRRERLGRRARRRSRATAELAVPPSCACMPARAHACMHAAAADSTCTDAHPRARQALAAHRRDFRGGHAGEAVAAQVELPQRRQRPQLRGERLAAEAQLRQHQARQLAARVAAAGRQVAQVVGPRVWREESLGRAAARAGGRREDTSSGTSAVSPSDSAAAAAACMCMQRMLLQRLT